MPGPHCPEEPGKPTWPLTAALKPELSQATGGPQGGPGPHGGTDYLGGLEVWKKEEMMDGGRERGRRRGRRRESFQESYQWVKTTTAGMVETESKVRNFNALSGLVFV